MKSSRKSIGMIISLAMVTGLFTAIPTTTSADEGYTYVERYWDSERQVVGSVTKSVKKPEVLSSTDCDMIINAYSFHVVDGNVRIRGKLECQGDVKILVCDGSTLTVDDGIIVQKSSYGVWNHLSIYGQENDTGKVIATGCEYDNGMTTYRSAGIGSYQGFDNGCSDIYIHGGDIHATGAENAAGIGNAKGKTGGSVTIFGGTVRAESYDSLTGVGSDGAGIGGAEGLKSEEGGNHLDNVTIYGGKVTAISHCHGAGIGGGEDGNGGNINIYGGTVIAISEGDGAGIGGGWNGAGGNINIYGGNVNATGQDDGAGIGGGLHGNSGNINIYNGSVTATSVADGAGIGGGDSGNGENINIYGGVITAQSEDEGAGIGGGYDGNGGTIKIYGGVIHALNDDQGAGIGGGDTGDGGDIYIYGGDITAMPKEDGAAIGGGDGGGNGNLTIGDGMRVESGSSAAGVTLKTKDNRVSGCRELYAHVYACTEHDVVSAQKYTPNTDGTTHSNAFCNLCGAPCNSEPHNCGAPTWTWDENHTSATAAFNCPTCGYSETVNADVTGETQAERNVSVAKAAKFGTAYINVFIQDESEDTEELQLLTGIFNYNNQLLSADLRPYYRDNDTFSIAITEPHTEDGEYYRIMLWDTNLRPLINPIHKADNFFE